MPVLLRPKTWVNLSPFQLEQWGRRRALAFCKLNGIECPSINVVPRKDWHVAACAYYRPDTEANRKWMSKLAGQGPGINICLERCARLATEEDYRNWNWPGSTADREPLGVIAHELGHHCDWLRSGKKGTYFGDNSVEMREESGEEPLTSYCPDDAEWFAEMFRLFVTNPTLLREIRPRTFEIFSEVWKTFPGDDWRTNLGEGVPMRVERSLENKVKKEGRR